jgi:hypothetical protein
VLNGIGYIYTLFVAIRASSINAIVAVECSIANSSVSVGVRLLRVENVDKGPCGLANKVE